MIFEQLIAAFFCFVSGCQSFNIAQRVPIIKKGPKGSYFGLAVAEHYVVANPTKMGDVIMLAGAPTAEAQDYHGPGSDRPGALFRCGVNTDQTDCEVVTIHDPVVSVQINNSHQWLGMTLKTEKPGGKIAVCAPLFTLRGGTSQANIIWEAEFGRCYLLEHNFQPSSYRFEWVPCLGKLDPSGSYTHEWFGYCQAGMSVDFAHTVDEDIVFGMPGPFHWTGAINSYEMSPNEFFPVSLWSKEDDRKGVVPQNSYLGFSLATGNISGSFVNFVSGAPRADSTGVVVIFEKQEIGATKFLAKNEILHGERLASAFGYSVQIVDITGDGRDDLLVGAPQYYDRDNKQGGAVYVYINKGLKKIGPKPTKILYGDIDSAFGTSITNLGDINMDGVNDVAIGAPGHNGGTGAVYIYHGSSDPKTGIQSEPEQVLLAQDLINEGLLHVNYSSFGYSVSGGLDMDLNGYPDLLVGSLSDSMLLFRSRPIVNVQVGLTTSRNKISIVLNNNPALIEVTKPNSNKKLKFVSFDVTLCMNYTSTPASFDEPVSMEYNIMLDSARVRNNQRPRLSFDPFNFLIESNTGVLKMPPQSKRKSACITNPVYLSPDIQDKLSPMELTASFNVLNKEIPIDELESRLPSFSKFPVMNNQISNITGTQVNISKGCGSDEICQSNLQMDARYVVLRNDDMWHDLQRDTPAGTPLLVLGTEKEIGFKVDISNPNGEDAHQAKMQIILPPFLQYSGLNKVNATAATISCTTSPGNLSLVTCHLGNPFRGNSKLSFIVGLGNDDSLYLQSEFSLRVTLQTSSTQPKIDIPKKYLVLVRLEAQINMAGYTTVNQLHFGGEVIGESAVGAPKDAGLIVGHTYEITNKGNSEIEDVYLNVSWPQLIQNGKWLFYLLSTEISGGVDGASKCNVPVRETNPLGLKLPKSSDKSRQKREADANPEAKTQGVRAQGPASASEILKCSGLAKCVEFQCQLGNIPADTTVFVHLQAVIWNSTFLEEYYGVAEIRVYSNATVAIDRGNILYSQSSVLDFEVSTSILSEQIISTEVQVNWWIIAVATLAGVILLVVIVLVLWRCGFFKRRRDFDYHKARRHQQASKKADEDSDRKLY